MSKRLEQNTNKSVKRVNINNDPQTQKICLKVYQQQTHKHNRLGVLRYDNTYGLLLWREAEGQTLAEALEGLTGPQEVIVEVAAPLQDL